MSITTQLGHPGDSTRIREEESVNQHLTKDKAQSREQYFIWQSN